MFFFISYILFHTFPTEIDLRSHVHLRLLRFNLRLETKEIQKSPDSVIQWFDSTCESVKSTSLVVEVEGFSSESEVCNKIQDSLLGLKARIETLSVYLFNKDGLGREMVKVEEMRKLFSKLYEAGIVIEKYLQGYRELVRHCFLDLLKLYSEHSCLA